MTTKTEQLDNQVMALLRQARRAKKEFQEHMTISTIRTNVTTPFPSITTVWRSLKRLEHEGFAEAHKSTEEPNANAWKLTDRGFEEAKAKGLKRG